MHIVHGAISNEYSSREQPIELGSIFSYGMRNELQNFHVRYEFSDKILVISHLFLTNFSSQQFKLQISYTLYDLKFIHKLNFQLTSLLIVSRWKGSKSNLISVIKLSNRKSLEFTWHVNLVSVCRQLLPVRHANFVLGVLLLCAQ